jgi:hypothetical protein
MLQFLKAVAVASPVRYPSYMKKFSRMMNWLGASWIAGPARAAAVCAALFLVSAPVSADADQVEMQNGDRYLGRVVSLNEDALVLQSDLLGKVTLPRARIATISLGAPAPASAQVPPAPARSLPQATPVAPTLSTNDTPVSALRNLGANTNLIEQIRGQFLTGAGGAANNKFDELLTGLMTGKMDMDGLRAQAKSSAEQLRALKRESGGGADASLDFYLDILDNFLKETAQPPNIATNAGAKGN